MAICPAGHQTNHADFCDTCGLPVGEATAAPMAAPSESVVPVLITCPACGTSNVTEALFCESCGYDFTTGAPAPAAAEPSDPASDAPASAPASQPAPDPLPAPSLALATPEPTSGSAPAEPVVVPASAAPARPAVEWVAELWIDPDWYTAQGSTDPMPSIGLPDIVPLTKATNVIGRVSHSKGIFPDIDCELDTGCSRRHAQLTTDGTRWWIEDLNSANGTFVGSASGPLPGMPIPQGRVELSAGQRIYVGAWTRIVIRKATEDEREAFAS